MSYHNSSEALAFIFLAISLVLLLSGLFWFPYYTGLKRGPGFLALLASVITGVLRIAAPLLESGPRTLPYYDAKTTLAQFASCAAIVFLTAFALRLWGRWVGEKATVEERLPGMPGMRAWFSTGNMVVCGFLVLTLWYGFDLSPLLVAVLVGAALAAYPLFLMESPAAAPAPEPDDSSAEREKIVAMLEAGKLTPDESAELLQALRKTSPPPMRQVPLTGGQRLMLIGAALVGLGFFLPWFVINPSKEVTHLMNQMQLPMNFSPPPGMILPGGQPSSGGSSSFSDMKITTPTMSVSGGDIQRGLGWAALVFALAAALLPYVATTLDTATTRTVRLLCLGIGSFIMLYLATQNLRFVGIGLVMAVGGYALEVAGVLRERRVSII